MDDATARRMHSLLAHKPGEHPASCPICEAQVKRDVILQQVEPMERERNFNDE